jgi:3'-phosphoadenosine 5'-phosphosulfate sulfotransferase (PAPS reductase)/FAD synthetase
MQVKDLPVDFKVVHVDTTISLPGVKEYVLKMCKRYKWHYRIVKPKSDFFSLAKNRGMPTRRGRWCCFQLKIAPLIEYTMKMERPRIQITGMRAHESTRRSMSVSNGEISQLMWREIGEHYLYSPIFDWRKEDINKYVEQNNLPLNPIYDVIGRSGECMCGVYQTLKEIKAIRDNFPEFFDQFVELEKHFRSKGSAFYDYKNRKRIYASKLARSKIG